MKRVAGLLAAVLVAAACTDGSVQATPTLTTTTTSSGAATTVPPPQSTTTTPQVVTISYGSLFLIRSIPERTSTEGLEIQVNRPRLSGFDLRPQIPTVVNNQLDAFLESRRATYLPNPDLGGPPAEYGLDFEVLWLEEDAWPVLSIVYTETAFRAGSSVPSTERFVLLFDLPTGDRLALAEMLTLEGVEELQALVYEQLEGVLGEGFCCFEPGALVQKVGVAADGLVAYVDASDGIPEEVGPSSFLIPWAEVADSIDMRQRFLARRAVEQGRCSAQGEDWVLEDQAGLPEPVVAKRRAIFEAALACDFEGLEALAGLDEPYSLWGFVSEMGGSAEAWWEGEAAGYAPVWFLARTLNLSYVPEAYSYGEDQTLEWRGYVWPAAASDEGWLSVPADRRAELADLYGEESMASYSKYGWFTGYRVMISDDGTWWYFGFGGD